MDVALAQEGRVQKYNEFGTVVVQITVNRNGNVIAAKIH
jgi:outer membrane biosynthesis protein TonB